MKFLRQGKSYRITQIHRDIHAYRQTPPKTLQCCFVVGNY